MSPRCGLRCCSAPAGSRRTSSTGCRAAAGTCREASRRDAATLLERFRGRDGVQLAVLVEASNPRRADAALERTRAAVSRFSDVRVAGSAQRFENGTAAVLPLLYVGDEDEATARGAALRETLVTDANGTAVRVIGEPALRLLA